MSKTSKKNKQDKKEGVGVNGNLIPAKKGEVRNPKGRPKKGSAIADILNEIGAETVNIGGLELTKKKALMMKIYSLAIKGESWAAHFVADRTEGKAIDRIITKEDKDELIVIG